MSPFPHPDTLMLLPIGIAHSLSAQSPRGRVKGRVGRGRVGDWGGGSYLPSLYTQHKTWGQKLWIGLLAPPVQGSPWVSAGTSLSASRPPSEMWLLRVFLLPLSRAVEFHVGDQGRPPERCQQTESCRRNLVEGGGESRAGRGSICSHTRRQEKHYLCR